MYNYDLALEWFKAIDQIFAKENAREDMYILSQNCEDLGIKLRSLIDEKGNKLRPRLEIKWRKNKKPDFEVVDRQIYGTMEEWIKWGWILEDPPISNDSKMKFFSTAHNGPSIKITKSRFLRRYLFQDNTHRSVEWVDFGKYDGLQFEITKITKGEDKWWSIGFETIGNKNNELEFRSVVQKILKDFKVKLERKDSLGYPEWIKLNFKWFT